MKKIFLDENDNETIGYKLSEVDLIIFKLHICGVDFNLVKYLQDQGVLDENGHVINNKFGMVGMKEIENCGFFEKTVEEYIFVSIEGTMKLIDELKQRQSCD